MLETAGPEMFSDHEAELTEIERGYRRFRARRPDLERPFWPVALGSVAAGAGLFIAGALFALDV